jgi:hypothetical protein
LALFVYSLPVHTAVDSGTGGPSVLIPSGLIDRETESTSGVIHRGMDGIFLEKEAEMVYRFTFWSGAELESIQEIILNVEKPAYDTVSPPPLVAVWDPLDEQWDPLEIDWGANVIPEAERYVSSTGIRIRLQTGDWSCHLTDTSLQARGAIE